MHASLFSNARSGVVRANKAIETKAFLVFLLGCKLIPIKNNSDTHKEALNSSKLALISLSSFR
jgi:hypothetical protein